MEKANFSLTFTANAGIIGTLGDFNFLLDALHDERTPDFSSLTGDMAERVLDEAAKTPPEALLVTHYHRDHCSLPLMERARERFPQAALIMPSLSPEIASGEAKLKNATVRWRKLTHQKAKALGDPANYGFLIESAGLALLTAGDATPYDGRILELLGGKRPDVALLNFPWITTRKGRELTEIIAPRRLIVFHLPYPAEDKYGWCKASEKAAAELRPLDVRLLLRFLQREEMEL